jgi:hypothetical protein
MAFAAALRATAEIDDRFRAEGSNPIAATVLAT